MNKIKYSKIIIIGSGPSGYTSALYIIRSNLNLIMVGGKSIGGQLTNTNFIENWPSVKIIKGVELMLNFYKQLKNYNFEFYNDEIYRFNLLNKPFIFIGKNFFYICDFLIICTGSFYKVFDIEKQFKFIGKNISNCATCDGNFYHNKKVCVIGGGDSCFENIFYLAKLSNFIILINRNKIFRANFELIKKIFYNFKSNIFFKLNYFLLEFLGDDFLLYYIKIKNFFNFNVNIIYLDGLFLFIGNISNSKIVLGQLKIFKNYILTRKKNYYNFTSTSLNSVFAAGDVQDFLYKQAIISSSTGCFSYFDLINYYKKLFY